MVSRSDNSKYYSCHAFNYNVMTLFLRLSWFKGAFWTNDAGESPAPFTVLLKADIESGKWKPRDSSLMEYVQKYCEFFQM